MACTWPNEPAGFSPVNGAADVQFNWQPVHQVPQNGWVFNVPGSVTLITDGSAPCDGSGKALDFFYPSGWPAGFAPGTGFLNFGTHITAGGVYVGFYFKYSSPWQSEPLNKMVSIYNDSLNPGVFLETRTFNSLPDTSAMRTWGVIESTRLPGNAQSYFPNITDPTVTQGVWHQAEILFNIDTNRLLWYLNGALVADYTTGPILQPGDGFSQFVIFPSWGGIGNNVAADQHWYISHVRVSSNFGSGVVTITTPTASADHTTTQPTVDVGGTAPPGTVQVTVANPQNGSAVVATGTTTFRATGVTLLPGLNNLIASALKADATTVSAAVNVTYKRRCPAGRGG